jgi:hypothetical protein
VCPMREKFSGHTEVRLSSEDPLILKFLDAQDTKVLICCGHRSPPSSVAGSASTSRNS